MHSIVLPILGAVALASSSPNFYFGVSNAAFQVEGNPQDSDWYRWTHGTDPQGQPYVKDGTNADVGTGFWTRYQEDFDLAQGQGMNAFRISIAWERVEPAPGVWDDAALAHYATMVAAMRQRGLEPFITLQHFVLPRWVADRGGLLWDDYPSHFAQFAAHVAGALAQSPTDVRYFVTINEPNIQVFVGYMNDHKFPPGINDTQLATAAFAQLARAHIEAFNAIHALQIDGVRVGVSHNWQVYRPADATSEADRVAAAQVNQMYNGAFMDAVLTGHINVAMPGAVPVERHVALPYGPSLDFVGVQNYGQSLVAAQSAYPGFSLGDGNGPRNDMGWEIVPDALYNAVAEIAAYGYPVIVTETGTADHRDTLRQQYLRYNFASIRRLLADDVPLFGYIHWSLTDNFEWDSGLTPRFGLVAVDYETLQYTPRPSLALYGKLIAELRSHELQPDFCAHPRSTPQSMYPSWTHPNPEGLPPTTW